MSHQLNPFPEEKFMAVFSGKVPENSMNANVKRKRRNADVAETSRKKIRGSKVSLSTDHCNVTQDISVRKRRAGDHEQMIRKRMKRRNLSSPSQHSDNSLEAIRIQRGKKKARDDAVRSKKRKSCVIKTNTNEPRIISEQECLFQPKKRNASDDGGMPDKKTRSSNNTSSTKSSTTESSSSIANKDVKSDDNRDVCLIYNNISPEEEKIYEMSSSGNTSRMDFTEKYVELTQIGMGGFSSVYCGYRRTDLLPVAMKHIASRDITFERVVCNGKVYNVILEVALMLKATGLTESVGQSAAVSLVDWYLLEDELILVMEKPALCKDLYKYLKAHRGPLEEREAKIILRQLVDAAIDMHAKGVFHRDIKLQNVLVQFNTEEPRVRVIDFGCGHFSTEESYFSMSGTPAYFPPEWFDYRAYWARPTTVWQLGALFYSLLNGHGHFRTTDFISNHIQINSALSTDCKILLHMCLARDPAERATLEDLRLCPTLRETISQTNQPSTYPTTPQ